MKDNIKKILYLIGGALITLILYCIFISIYTKVVKNPIIFFASILIGIVTSVLAAIIIYLIGKKYFTKFVVFLMGIIYFLLIILFAVFGPTFVDRSISYHLVFLVVEEKEISMDEMEEKFSKAVFDKRMSDALTTGFVKENKKGKLVPTTKAKIMYKFLKIIGKSTNSLDNYNEMKEQISNVSKKNK